MPLRDGVQLTTSLSDGTTAVVRSPVTNSVAGAIEIQELIDRNEWAAESGDPAAYARHLRLKPLAGVPPKSVILQVDKGDRVVTNPASTAVIRAGDLADRTTFYRNDLAFSANPTSPAVAPRFPDCSEFPGSSGGLARSTTTDRLPLCLQRLSSDRSRSIPC